MEFIKIVLSFIVGVLLAYIYENLPFSKVFGIKKLVINRWKFHHSLYGVLLILLSFHFQENFVILFSSGVGVIVEHYLTGGGLDFITKEK